MVKVGMMMTNRKQEIKKLRGVPRIGVFPLKIISSTHTSLYTYSVQINNIIKKQKIKKSA